jgi:hypothetical protein
MPEDALARISNLMKTGYALHLKRNALGACSAELSRGWWPFRRQVRIDLVWQVFEAAKRLLGNNLRRRVKHRRR